MQQFVGRVLTAFAFFVALALSSSANSASITVAPGSLFGYIPLEAFGTTPLAGVGDETINNVTTPPISVGGADLQQSRHRQ